MQFDSLVSALVLACTLTLMLAVFLFVLIRRLQQAQLQRDLALAQVGASEWQMCDGFRNQHPCIEQCSARRMHSLQEEVADLRIRDQLLQIQAHYDSLTGLANRLLLADRFHLALERAKRSGKPFALFMVDLNDFKAINDNHGHATGDIVLIVMAERLESAVRASDTVARLGGDEFVLIVESISDRGELGHLGRKISGLLSESIALENGVDVKIGASVGFAVYPDNGAVMDDLLDIADRAMYECKHKGLLPFVS